jgi:hypothetical protein
LSFARPPLCIRALDHCPPVDITFGDFSLGRAAIQQGDDGR